MNAFVAGLLGILAASGWLALLVASDFSAMVVDGGLLVALIVIGGTNGDGTRRPRSGLGT